MISQDIILRSHTNPLKIFGLREQPDTYVDVDMDEEWTIPASPTYSRAGWTPFAGRKVVGRVKRVVLRGEIAYVDGKVSSLPPSISHSLSSSLRCWLSQDLVKTSISNLPPPPPLPLVPNTPAMWNPSQGLLSNTLHGPGTAQNHHVEVGGVLLP